MASIEGERRGPQPDTFGRGRQGLAVPTPASTSRIGKVQRLFTRARRAAGHVGAGMLQKVTQTLDVLPSTHAAVVGMV